MPQRTQTDHAPLPRRVRPGNHHPRVPHVHVPRNSPADPDDLSALSDSVRRLLRQRPDLAHPVLPSAPDPENGTAPPVFTLITDLLVALTEVHRLALTIGAHDEAADIARLIDTLRTTT